MKVLIVDDDIATVEVIEKAVNWNNLGVTDVFTAYNVASARDIIRGQEVDIIVSDIEMPQASGIDLLKWCRDNGFDGEFLLLTCHESFDYAQHAMKYRASEYLLKPFDVGVMQEALGKVIVNLKQQRILQENSQYGKWIRKNKRQMYTDFWLHIFTGRIREKREILGEIEKRSLDLDGENNYYLVISKTFGLEKAKEKLNEDFIVFVMENIYTDTMCGDVTKNRVCGFNETDGYYLIAVCEGKDRQVGDLERKCKSLIDAYQRILGMEVTICISKEENISDFYESYRRIKGLIEKNVSYFGSYFYEEESICEIEEADNLLEIESLEKCFLEKRKMDILSMLKQKLNERAYRRLLDDKTLKLLKSEFLQGVYLFLGKENIHFSAVSKDENLGKLESKSTQSVIDFLKWANYLVDLIFTLEEEVRAKSTISDKINQYIAEHYAQNIGRNEIALEFGLTAEYIAKIYKKETGNSLNEAIAEFRIGQAKYLLKRGERVSQVASKVGFDNFTYFSTTFKKIEGITPNQYRKQEKQSF